jgi:hypothetical protein
VFVEFFGLREAGKGEKKANGQEKSRHERILPF